MNYLWVIKLIIALTTGLYLVRQIKDYVLAFVIRLMPRRYRISSDSATLHARMATILSIVLMAFIGGGTYWGLTVATSLVTTTETQGIVTFPQKPHLEKPKPESIPDDHSTIPIRPFTVNHQEQEEAVSTTTRDEIPARKTSNTYTEERYQPIAIVAQPKYYLQVAATKDLRKAQIRCDELRQQWKIPCKIGVDNTHAYSYKILLGGFANLADTQTFQRKYRLKGFPRAKTFYEYIIE